MLTWCWMSCSCEKQDVASLVPIADIAPDLMLRDAQSRVIDYNEIEMKEKLGEGAFASVYRGIYQVALLPSKKLWATQLVQGKEVAVKVISVLKDETGETVDPTEKFLDFQREAWIMRLDRSWLLSHGFSGLSHRNLVALKAICLKPTCMIMVGRVSVCVFALWFQEYVANGSLFALLHSNRILTWRLRMRIAIDVSRAMEFWWLILSQLLLFCSYLHTREPPLAHLDLKSLNILVLTFCCSFRQLQHFADI